MCSGSMWSVPAPWWLRDRIEDAGRPWDAASRLPRVARRPLCRGRADLDRVDRAEHDLLVDQPPAVLLDEDEQEAGRARRILEGIVEVEQPRHSAVGQHPQ